MDIECCGVHNVSEAFVYVEISRDSLREAKTEHNMFGHSI